MRLIHLLLIFSLVWILYCMYVYILPVYLFEKIVCYSYRRKIIDIQHFPYIFNGPFQYFGGVPTMRLIHLLFISSLVRILYCMYVDILYLFENFFFFFFFFFHITAKLLINSIFSMFLIVRSGISEASLQ